MKKTLENDKFSIEETQKKGGFKKIKSFEKEDICQDSEHNPPTLIVLEPGVYEYTCPSCGHVTIVEIPLITM